MNFDQKDRMRHLFLSLVLICIAPPIFAEYPDTARVQRNLEMLVTGEKKLDQFSASERVEMRVQVQKIQPVKPTLVDLDKIPPANPPVPQIVELGPVDKWRFESCMDDATKNPTDVGVRVAVTSCRKRFAQ